MLEGTGRLRVGDETLTMPKYGDVLVGSDQLRGGFRQSWKVPNRFLQVATSLKNVLDVPGFDVHL